MKGNEKLIKSLNARLVEELTAINQYFVHAEMCEDWGYEILQAAIKKRSISEMKHAEKLIERILFL
jgi:bacterioferritin